MHDAHASIPVLRDAACLEASALTGCVRSIAPLWYGREGEAGFAPRRETQWMETKFANKQFRDVTFDTNGGEIIGVVMVKQEHIREGRSISITWLGSCAPCFVWC